MKVQKSNNPAAVGALLLVLTAIIGRTVWLVTLGDGSAQMASAVVAVPTASIASISRTPTPETPRFSAPTPQRSVPVFAHSARNPFAMHVAPYAPSHTPPKGITAPQAAPPPNGSPLGGADVTQVRPLPPLPVGLLPVLRASKRPAKPMFHSAAVSPPLPEPDPLSNIRLTAIVDGIRRMAVLQTTDPQPVVVHEGDTIQGLRVAEIHDREVVFVRGDKSWTLPLQTADTSVTVTTNDAAPTAQENADASH